MAALVIILSVSSCRETEDLSESNEFENISISAKMNTDFIGLKTETNQSSDTNNTSNLEETDPEKDKIKW